MKSSTRSLMGCGALQANSASSFELYNADTDSPIATFTPLTSGTVLNLAPLPTRNLNIRATTVRAIAYKVGAPSTNIDTHSYLFVHDVIRQPASIPGHPNNTCWLGGSQSNTAVHDHEMDPVIVDHPAYSASMPGAMKAIPSMSITADPGSIYGNTGFYDGTDVEEKVSVELLYPDAPEDAEQVEAGIESHSHKRLKRSLRLNFRAEYGDAKFRTELFRRFPMAEKSAPHELDRIILRAGNNRSWARIFSKEKTTYPSTNSPASHKSRCRDTACTEPSYTSTSTASIGASTIPSSAPTSGSLQSTSGESPRTGSR